MSQKIQELIHAGCESRPILCSYTVSVFTLVIVQELINCLMVLKTRYSSFIFSMHFHSLIIFCSLHYTDPIQPLKVNVHNMDFSFSICVYVFFFILALIKIQRDFEVSSWVVYPTFLEENLMNFFNDIQKPRSHTNIRMKSCFTLDLTFYYNSSLKHWTKLLESIFSAKD